MLKFIKRFFRIEDSEASVHQRISSAQARADLAMRRAEFTSLFQQVITASSSLHTSLTFATNNGEKLEAVDRTINRLTDLRAQMSALEVESPSKDASIAEIDSTLETYTLLQRRLQTRQ